MSQTHNLNKHTVPNNTTSIHQIAPPPLPPGATSLPPGQRIQFTPNGHALYVGPSSGANSMRSPIRSGTTTTLSNGNITLNTTASNTGIVPKTPPRFRDFQSYPLDKNATFTQKPVLPPRALLTSISATPTALNVRSSSPTLAEEEAITKRRKLNSGESMPTPSPQSEDDSSQASSEPSTPPNESAADLDASSASSSTTRKKKKEAATFSKGCSCKKTGCLKGYCDCFQNNRRCLESCNCVGCKNYDGSSELKNVLNRQGGTVYIKKATTDPKKINAHTSLNPNRTRAASQSYYASHNSNQVTNPSRSPSPSTAASKSTLIVPNRSITNSQNAPLVGFNNLLEVVAGPDAVVELCKRLLLTTNRREQVFTQQWQSQHRIKPVNTVQQLYRLPAQPARLQPPIQMMMGSPRTPPKPVNAPPAATTPSTQSSPDTLSLLCDEDDALQVQTQAPQSLQIVQVEPAKNQAPPPPPQTEEGIHYIRGPINNPKMLLQHVSTSSHKGFDNSLQVALEEAVLSEFNKFIRDKLDQYYALEQQIQTHAQHYNSPTE
ncbi:tesmin/TSO1-like CXC domain protein [Acrasis kona]|uniref:Tesmin/TSO1-like CXC domain protein n=1 Tax=Acrasis kona TaxID=1008807 RepID=A0AAW2ZPK0_9EUKA